MSARSSSTASGKAWMALYRILLALSVLLISAGLLLGGYVFTTQAIHDRQAQAQADHDEQTAARYSKQRNDGMLAAAHAYNERLFHNPQTIGAVKDPFSHKEDSFTGSSDPEYRKLLQAPGDVMAVLTIPRISLKIPIHHGASSDVLENGLGHLPGTSLPVGGRNTRAVITGHRGLPGHTLFTRLPELQKGDLFFITVCGRTLAYRVEREEVVLPSETKALRIDRGKDEVPLLTCTPYGINTHRMLITGERTQWPLHTAAPGLWPSITQIVEMTVALVLVGWAISWLTRDREPVGLHLHRWVVKPWCLRRPLRSMRNAPEARIPVPAGLPAAARKRLGLDGDGGPQAGLVGSSPTRFDAFAGRPNNR